MGAKRAQNKADPAMIEVAKQMRRAHATYREIAAATGLSKGTIGNYFQADPEFATPSNEALEAEDAEFLDRVNDVAGDGLTLAKGYLVELSKRLNGEKPKKGISEKGIVNCTKLITEMRKLAAVMRGKPTAITQTQRAPAEQEPVRTEQEKRALELLKKRAGGMPGGN